MKRSFKNFNLIFGMVIAFGFVGAFLYLLSQKEPLAATVALGIATMFISLLAKTYRG